jgi:DNA-binding MarR family transcriptional regulator
MQEIYEERVEQARFIHDTIHMIRNRLMPKHLGDGSEGCGCFPDLTMPQIHALLAIRDQEITTIKDLAEKLEVSPPSASVMVERLVDQGMASRQQSEADRRTVEVRLTTEGREVLDGVERMMLGAFMALLEKIGPDLSRQWVEVYGRIREVLLNDPAWRHTAPAGTGAPKGQE